MASSSVASFKYALEMKETAALALVIGFIALQGGIGNVAGFTTQDQDWNGSSTPPVYPPSVIVASQLNKVVFGLSNVLVGAWLLMGKAVSKLAATFNVAITFTAWFPFLAMIARVSYIAANFEGPGPNGFVPVPATEGQVKSLATMGILGIVAYAGTTVGALTFFALKISAFSSGRFDKYNKQYYKSREAYYGSLTALSGILQIALGGYLLNEFDFSAENIPPATVTVFTITYPAMSIITGVVLLLFGAWVIMRGLGDAASQTSSGNMFNLAACSVYIFCVALQIMGQVVPLPGSAAGRSGQIANVTVMFITSFVLDNVARRTPDEITASEFSSTPAKELEEESKA
ncbi:unnamed protein product [Chrysoparadoxa australica]